MDEYRKAGLTVYGHEDDGTASYATAVYGMIDALPNGPTAEQYATQQTVAAADARVSGDMSPGGDNPDALAYQAKVNAYQLQQARLAVQAMSSLETSQQGSDAVSGVISAFNGNLSDVSKGSYYLGVAMSFLPSLPADSPLRAQIAGLQQRFAKLEDGAQQARDHAVAAGMSPAQAASELQQAQAAAKRVSTDAAAFQKDALALANQLIA